MQFHHKEQTCAALEYAFGYFNPASPARQVYGIVFTDGEDHEKLKGLELPEFPVQILFVGMSTKRQSHSNSENQIRTIYKKDKKGGVVITRRDEKILSNLMEEISAKYRRKQN